MIDREIRENLFMERIPKASGLLSLRAGLCEQDSTSRNRQILRQTAEVRLEISQGAIPVCLMFRDRRKREIPGIRLIPEASARRHNEPA